MNQRVQSAPRPEQVMFEEVKSAVEAGQRSRARDLLTRLLKTDQRNPDYWLWMSAVVDSQRERAYCLNEAYKLNPENRAVRWGMIMHGLLPPDPSLALPFDLQKRNIQIQGLAAQTAKEKLPASARILMRAALFGGGAILLVALLAVGIFGLRWGQEKKPASYGPILPLTLAPSSTYLPTVSPVVRSATPTFVGPTPLWMLLKATYTPTPLYVNTPHSRNEAYSIGMRAYQRGDWKGVITYMSQVATTEPNAVDVLFYLAEANRFQGEFAQAQQFANQAISLNNRFAPAYLSRARSVWARQGKVVDEVIRDLETAIERDPKYAEAYLELANARLSRNDPAAALKALDGAEKLAFDSPLLYLYRGQAYLLTGRTREALDNARQANQLDQTLLPAYRLLGRCLQAAGEFTESLAPLNTYLTYVPEDFEALVWLARGYAATQEEEAALDTLEKILRINRNFAEAYTQRGIIYLNRKEGQKALNDFTSAIRLKDESFNACIGLGQAYFMLNYPGDAYLQIERCVPAAKSETEKAALYYWRARSLEKINQPETALRDWKLLLGLSASSYPREWGEEARNRVQSLSSPTPLPVRTTSAVTPTRLESSSTPALTPTPTLTEFSKDLTLTPAP